MNRKHLLAAAVLLCGTDLVTACNGQTAVDGNSEVISSVDVSQEEGNITRPRWANSENS